ncbi:hypothetical protein BXZ70DRAFT_925679 [Cristinia sonorae]|uniref:Uncharacterized protein n=1 Tax=Cristinia sonorae TaxID=1940300 RepID=A0A8K0UU77_9AGAR|nr:hypothetical protein BXZ70DRAFT_925679 [Cristinia sonorae]
MSVQKRETYMGVPAVRPPLDFSYEEQRIQDYIKAYTTTGQPPQPVPETPTGAAERLALGLPPLFEPYVEGGGVGTVPPTSVSLSASVSNDPIRTLENLPDMHLFKPSKMEDSAGVGVFVEYQSIIMQKEFCHFSHEELRYQAYLKGNKTMPVLPNTLPRPTPHRANAIDLHPLITVTPALSGSLSTATSNTLGLTNGPVSGEDYQSITCSPPFANHSFEELRVAYLLLGREATSEEIKQQNHLIRLTV